MRNFQILVVCKQCLQTASASGELHLQTPYRGFAPGPHSLVYSPQVKIPDAATDIVDLTEITA